MTKHQCLDLPHTVPSATYNVMWDHFSSYDPFLYKVLSH